MNARIEYSKEAIEETIGICLKKLNIQYMARLAVYAAIIAPTVCFVCRNAHNTVKLFCGLIAFVGFIVLAISIDIKYKINKEKYMKMYLDNIQTKYHAERIEMPVHIDKDNIIVHKTEGNEETLYTKDIEYQTQTENYLVIQMKGGILLNIPKSSIEEGSPEEIMELIKQS